MKRVAAALVLAVLIAAILSGCGKAHPRNTVSDFLTLVQKGDYNAAYELLSSEAKAKSTLEQFRTALEEKDKSLGKVTKFEYQKGFLGAEQSSMTFSVTRTKDGKDTTTSANFGMLLDQGKWRITDGF